MSDKPLLQVDISWSPALGQKPFSGKAWAVSSENKLGKFDVLPLHANFISQIFGALTIHLPEEAGKKELNYKFKGGVLEVSNDQVKIFLGI